MNKAGFVLILLLFACGKSDLVDSSDEEHVIVGFPQEDEPITCEQSSCWSSSVFVCRDSSYIDFFTRTTGWTGGDATYSVDLQNGKTLWLFGDTFIDQVSEDRSRPSFNLINNSLVLQDGNTFTTIHGGTTINPDAYAKPPEESDWYWPGDGTVADGKLYQFMHGFGRTEGGEAWDFYRTSIDLLTINIGTLEIESNQRLWGETNISWGAAIMEDDDFSYLYGVKSVDFVKRLYVARSNANLSADWEYFDGEEWVMEESQSAPIFDHISEQFSVWKEDDTYYLLNQHNVFGKEIFLYTSASPSGDFGNEKVIYCTPETGGDIFTYNAFAHPHIYQDSLLVSYNINSFDANDLLESADNYRPYFVRVGGWRQ